MCEAASRGARGFALQLLVARGSSRAKRVCRQCFSNTHWYKKKIDTYTHKSEIKGQLDIEKEWAAGLVGFCGARPMIVNVEWKKSKGKTWTFFFFITDLERQRKKRGSEFFLNYEQWMASQNDRTHFEPLGWKAANSQKYMRCSHWKYNHTHL